MRSFAPKFLHVSNGRATALKHGDKLWIDKSTLPADQRQDRQRVFFTTAVATGLKVEPEGQTLEELALTHGVWQVVAPPSETSGSQRQCNPT